MPSPQNQTFTPPPNPSAPGSPEWFYDEIMRHIEPDLITVAIPQHAEYYKDETKEERVKRITAYDKAFSIYDKIAAQAEVTFQNDLHALRNKAHQEAVKQEKKEQERGVDEAEVKLDEIENS